MKKLLTLILSLSFFSAGLVLPATAVNKEGKATKAQDDRLVVNSGSATAQTGTSEAKAMTLSISSEPPQLTAEQMEMRAEEEQEEHIVPVPQGKVWTSIPPPSDPPSNIVSTDPAKIELSKSRASSNNSVAVNASATDLRYQTVTDLTTIPSTQHDVIGEPSVANMGSVTFYTGNWYAARSTDGGQTFSYINPSSAFSKVNNGFCCDQITNYVPSQDLLLWSLQYIDDGNSNTLRLAWALGSAGVTSNNWKYLDFNPQLFGFPAGKMLDFPNLTLTSTYLYVTSTYLYVTSNVFGVGDSSTFAGSVILRIRLSDLAAGGAVPWSYYPQNRSASDVGGLRCTEGATSTMYWAGWHTTSQLRIFHWDDSGTTISWDDVDVAAYTQLDRDGVATSPDGTNWAGRADSRLLGAWVAKGVIGFMWMAKQDSTHPYPYTIVAQFDQSTRNRTSQNQIWGQNNAWLYPTASVNAAGNLAGLLQYGGGDILSGNKYLDIR